MGGPALNVPIQHCFLKGVIKCLMKTKNGVDGQSKVVNVNVKITSVRLDLFYFYFLFLNQFCKVFT